ncbi:MAG TPA: ferritin family protein [Longimicrobiales bacterium]|nr:ferritin family protein [Longimicrobiales bacterium]
MNPALKPLHDARAAEKEQTLFYRSLAAEAEAAEDPATAERLNGLLADEQHHLSRLTARLLELGERVADLTDSTTPPAALTDWEAEARARESAEVARYQAIPTTELDPITRVLIEEILATERNHQRELGGKWTMA